MTYGNDTDVLPAKSAAGPHPARWGKKQGERKFPLITLNSTPHSDYFYIGPVFNAFTLNEYLSTMLSISEGNRYIFIEQIAGMIFAVINLK